MIIKNKQFASIQGGAVAQSVRRLTRKQFSPTGTEFESQVGQKRPSQKPKRATSIDTFHYKCSHR